MNSKVVTMRWFTYASSRRLGRMLNALGILALSVGAGSWGTAAAAEYPTKPVTILCWSKPGSPVDIFARTVAPLLSKELGQPVVVETKAGGSGVVAVNALLAQPPDGYTLLAATKTLTTLFSEKGVKFKPGDIQPLINSQADPFAIIVPASSPFKTLSDFIKYAKANPGKLKVAGPFAMSAHRIAFERLSEAAKFDATWVPYEGGGPTLVAVAGAQVDAGHTNAGNTKPQVAAGKVRVIGVTAGKRLVDFPDAPTYKESGVELETYQWRGFVTKKGVPQAVVDKLVAALRKVQQTPDYQAYLKKVSQLDHFEPPAEFARVIAQDTKDVTDIKKKLGL